MANLGTGGSGFDYTIEIKDKFAAALAAYRAAMSEGKIKTEEFTAALGDFAAKSQEVASVLGQATTKQKAALSDLERAEALRSKRADKKRIEALAEQLDLEAGTAAVEEKVVALNAWEQAQVNIARSARAQAVAESEAMLRAEGMNGVISERVALLKAQAIANAADQKQIVNQQLVSLGRDPKTGLPPVAGLTEEQSIQESINAIIARQTELRAINEGLKEKGLDPRGNVILTEEQSIQESINAIIARQTELRAINEGLKEKGLDPRGNVILTEEQAIDARVNAILEKQIVLRAVNDQLRQRGLGPNGAPILSNQQIGANNAAAELQRLEIKKFTQAATEATPEIAALKRELGETDGVGNRLSFTFRRLFGILAAFTIIRFVVQGIGSGIKDAIAFDKSIEDTTQGIAALITATAQVEDATGHATTAQQGWTIATAAAREQVALLRKDNLLTAATFDELAKGFQASIGPGLTNGLNLDQIRQLTVLSSEAATALTLEQSRLPQEIRALLTGAITPRTARIATSLGITNEDITRAKEAGVLFEFLDQKLQSFNKAAQEGQKNFSVLITNVKDDLLGLFGQAFESTFVKFKDLLNFIHQGLIQITGTGITINPALVKTFSVIGSVLDEAVDQVKIIMQSLSAKGAEDTFVGIAGALRLALVVASDLIQGILKASAIISTITAPIIKVLEAIASIIGPFLNQVLVWAIALGAAAKMAAVIYGWLSGWVIKLGTSAILIEKMKDNLFKTVGYLADMDGAKFLTIGLWASVLALVVAIGYEISGWKDKLEANTGVTGTWGDALGAFFVKVRGLAAALNADMLDVFTTAFNYMEIGIANVLIFLVSKASDAIQALVALIPGGAALGQSAKDQTDKALLGLEAAKASAQGNIDEGGGLLSRVGDRNDSAQALANAAFAKGRSSAKTLDDIFANAPGIIGSSTKDEEEAVKGTQKLKDEYAAANEELKIAVLTLRAQGAELAIAKDIAKALSDIDKQSLPLKAQQVQAERDLARAKADQLTVGTKIGSLTKDEQAYVQNIYDLQQQRASQVRAINEEQNKNDILHAQLAKGSVSLPEVQASDARLGSFKAGLDQIKASEAQIPINQKLVDLAMQRTSAEGQEADAQRRLTEGAKEGGKLEQQIWDIQTQKIAALGLAEYEAQTKRKADLQAQINEARASINVRGSRVPGEEQLVGASNAVETAQLKASDLASLNRAQELSLHNEMMSMQSVTLKLALYKLLGLTTANNAKAEEIAEIAVKGAEIDRLKVIQDIYAARAKSLLAGRTELLDIKDQVSAAKNLLIAKESGTTFDEQMVQANAGIQAAETKLEITKLQQVLDEREAQRIATSAVGTEEIKKAQQDLITLKQKDIQTVLLQLIGIKTLQAAQKQAIQEQLNQSRETRTSTAGSATNFNQSFFGTDTQTEGIIKQAGALADAQAHLQSLLNLNKADSAEIEKQTELVRQEALQYQRLMDQANRPISQGLIDGLRQFAKQAPSVFATISTATTSLLQGAAKIGADALSNLFGKAKNNIRQEIGQLLQSVGNQIFNNLLQQLLSKALAGLVPGFIQGETAGTTLITAATVWEPVATTLLTAATILAGTAFGAVGAAEGGPIGFAHGGPVRFFASGASGSFHRDARDTIPAMLRPREYVLRPEAVERLGLPFLNSLNSLSFNPQGMSEVANMGIGSMPRTSTQAPRASTSKAAGSTTHKIEVGPVQAYMVPSEQMMEQLLAQGDGAMQRYLNKNGYTPKWHSS